MQMIHLGHLCVKVMKRELEKGHKVAKQGRRPNFFFFIFFRWYCEIGERGLQWIHFMYTPP